MIKMKASPPWGTPSTKIFSSVKYVTFWSASPPPTSWMHMKIVTLEPMGGRMVAGGRGGGGVKMHLKFRLLWWEKGVCKCRITKGVTLTDLKVTCPHVTAGFEPLVAQIWLAVYFSLQTFESISIVCWLIAWGFMPLSTLFQSYCCHWLPNI